MEITLAQCADLTKDVLKAGLVPNIQSSPGLGKSSMIYQIAEEYNLKVIDFRLAQSDPTDLNGFPTLIQDRTRSDYAPPLNIPIEGDEIPEGYSGWLLFFDEMNAAPPAVQAASYKIVLDRKVGDHNLHPKVAMACAGNLATDKAIVTRLSTAMQSRLIHFQVRVDNPTWIKWAIDNEVDHRVISFIRFRPELLHKFDPNHNDTTFPCPRTWDFMSRIIKPWEEVRPEKLPALAGTVGEGPALEFKGFTEVYSSLPSKEAILGAPEIISIPEEPSILYAITGLISNYMNKDNIDKMMTYVSRLPVEFQVIGMQGVIRGDNSYKQHPEVRKWISRNAEEFM